MHLSYTIIRIRLLCTLVSLVSDELQELRQMRDATRLHIAQVMNIKPGVRECTTFFNSNDITTRWYL